MREAILLPYLIAVCRMKMTTLHYLPYLTQTFEVEELGEFIYEFHVSWRKRR